MFGFIRSGGIGVRLSELGLIAEGGLKGPDAEFHSVSIDTRTLKPGDLFIAIRGPRFDGHEFVALARSLGACAAMVEDMVDDLLPQLQVYDTRLALGRLGAAWRQASSARVVGLTGSNGKTTTKEMIAAILGLKGAVLSTRGNLNNDLGVPLTLLGLGEEHRYAVIEMGANHLREIEYTAGLARPEIALITNAGEAHLEGFGSREGVARGKAEIIGALGPEGVAVLNADDAFYPLWRDVAAGRRVLSFGFGEGADVRGVMDSVRMEWTTAGFETHFSCWYSGHCQPFSLQLAGYHNVANALAATAVCLGLGLSLGEIAVGLSSLAPVSGRIQPCLASNGALLINDTYNANPSSFKAAVEVLTAMPGEPWIALGAFGELGEDSASLHADLGLVARRSGVARLLATGPHADKAVESFGAGAEYFPCQDELIKKLTKELREDVALLVKGSRSQRMETVVEALKAGS